MISLILSSGKIILEIEKDKNNYLDVKAIKEKLLESNIVYFTLVYNVKIIYYSFVEICYYKFIDNDEINLTLVIHDIEYVKLISTIYKCNPKYHFSHKDYCNIYKLSLLELKKYYYCREGVYNYLKDDNFVLFYTLYYCPEFILLFPDNLLNDVEYIINLIENINYSIISFLPHTSIIFQKKDFLLELIKNININNNYETVEILSIIIKNNIIDKEILNTIKEELTNFFLFRVCKNESEIQIIPHDYITDNIIIAAVKKNSKYINDVPIEKLNKKIILELVKHNGYIFILLITKLKINFKNNCDKKILIDLGYKCWNDITISDYLEYFMIDKREIYKIIDEEVVRIVIKKYPEAIKFIPHIYLTENLLKEIDKELLVLIPEKIKNIFLVKYFSL